MDCLDCQLFKCTIACALNMFCVCGCILPWQSVSVRLGSQCEHVDCIVLARKVPNHVWLCTSLWGFATRVVGDLAYVGVCARASLVTPAMNLDCTSGFGDAFAVYKYEGLVRRPSPTDEKPGGLLRIAVF